MIKLRNLSIFQNTIKHYAIVLQSAAKRIIQLLKKQWQRCATHYRTKPKIDLSDLLSETCYQSHRRFQKITVHTDLITFVSWYLRHKEAFSELYEKYKFPKIQLIITEARSIALSESRFLLSLLTASDLPTVDLTLKRYQSCHILSEFKQRFPRIRFVSEAKPFMHAFLHRKIYYWQCAAGLFAFFCILFFVGMIVFREKSHMLQHLKNTSNQLIHITQEHKLTSKQAFQSLQAYYQDFQSVFSDSIYQLQDLKKQCNQLVFQLMQLTQYSILLHSLKQHLSNYHQQWATGTVNRGNYLAYWLAYLDVLYPKHLLVPVVWQQIKQIFNALYHMPISNHFIDFYLTLLKQQGLETTILSDNHFFDAIKQQLAGQRIKNLFALTLYLQTQQQGAVTLETFLPDTNILLSQQQLAKVFIKKNTMDIINNTLPWFAAHEKAIFWFLSPSFDDVSALRSALVQQWSQAQLSAWGRFIASIQLRPTQSLLLASGFLNTVTQADSRFKKMMSILQKNVLLAPNISFHWASYDGVLKQLITDSHYILLDEHSNQAAKQMAQSVLLKQSGHLSQAKHIVQQWVLPMANPILAKSMAHYLQAPLVFYWKTLLANSLLALSADFRQSVLPLYQNMKTRFPFANRVDTVSPAQLKQWLSPSQGVLWQFVLRDLKGFVYYADRWRVQTWLGVGLPLSKRFVQQLNVLWQLSHWLFQRQQYHIQLAYFPVPSPAVVSQQLQIGNQQLLYENGPQSWHTFHWQPGEHVQMQIRMIGHQAAWQRAYFGPWSLLRLLTSTTLQHHITLLINPRNLVKLLTALQQWNAFNLSN